MKITITVTTKGNLILDRVRAANMLMDIATQVDAGLQKGHVQYPLGAVGDFTVTDETEQQ